MGIMTISRYIEMMRGYWAAILICTVVGGLAAALLSSLPLLNEGSTDGSQVSTTAVVHTALLTPQGRSDLSKVVREASEYRVKYRVLVSASSPSVAVEDPLDTALKLSPIIAQQMSSDLNLTKVAEGLGLNTVEALELKTRVAFSQLEETPYIDIYVHGDDEASAQSLARQIVDSFDLQESAKTDYGVVLSVVESSVTVPRLSNNLPDQLLLEEEQQLIADFIKANPQAMLRVGEKIVGLFDDALISVVETKLGLVNGTAESRNDLFAQAVPGPVDSFTGLATPSSETLISARDTDPDIARKLTQQAVEELQVRIGREFQYDLDDASLLVITDVTESSIAGAVQSKSSLLNNTVLGLLLGFVAGLIYALAKVQRDKRIRLVSQILPHTGTLPIGVVTTVTQGSTKNCVGGDFLVPNFDSYRDLRSNVVLGSPDAHVVAVSSPTTGGGGTSVALNLATVLAQSGLSVVLVEANPRDERLISNLGLEPGPGMSDVLTSGIFLNDAIQVWEPGGISVLGAGRPVSNPSELIASIQFISLLAELRQEYDYVLCLTGPLLDCSDAAVVARRTDGVLLVVRYEKTTTLELEAAVTSLVQIAAPIAGVVVTDVPVGETLKWKTVGVATSPLH